MPIEPCTPSLWLDHVVTALRDVRTDTAEFRKYSEFLGDILVMEAVNRRLIPMRGTSVLTPTESVVSSVRLDVRTTVAVSIVRAGNAFASSVLRLLSPSIPLGQLVIQRDALTALPVTIVEKVPEDTSAANCVIVLDPMLATGGSVIAAIKCLIAKVVEVDEIVLIHGFGCPEGIAAVAAAYPGIRGVVGVVDSHLNDRKYIIPGVGDFGDRFYG